MDDSDDYELMPKREIDELKRNLSSVKSNSLTEGDKAKILVESMERLTVSINRLITILDDAQKDIIDEYQHSKPVEKMNKLLNQNEMIAKAILTINDKLTPQYTPQPPSATSGQQFPGTGAPTMNQGLPQSMMNRQQNVVMNPSPLPPLDDLPSLDNFPPMNEQQSTPQKKKFLGFM